MPNPRGHLHDATGWTAAQTLDLCVETMQSHLPLVFSSPCYQPDDIWHVLTLAAAPGRSIGSAPADLATAPSPSTVRYQLKTHLFPDHDMIWRPWRSRLTLPWSPTCHRGSPTTASAWRLTSP